MNPGRYHLLLTTAGRPVQHGWWGSEATARRKFTTWIGEHGAIPDARVTLVDTETGTVLTTWPEEPYPSAILAVTRGGVWQGSRSSRNAWPR